MRTCYSVMIAAFVCLSCSGCGIFTATVDDIGDYVESPIENQPIVAAYVNSDESELLIQYRVNILDHGSRYEIRELSDAESLRWVKLKIPNIQEKRPSPDLPRQTTSATFLSKPDMRISAWKKLRLYTIADRKSKNWPPEPPYYLDQSFENKESRYFIPSVAGKAPFRFTIPSINKRSATGTALQTLKPVTIPIDIISAPIQAPFAFFNQ